MTKGGETVGRSSGSSQLNPGRGSAEMIGNGRSDADRKMLIKRVGQHLLPTAQARGLGWPGPPIAAPYTGNRHIDLFGHLTPGQALITQFHDLLCGCRMCGSATAHSDPGTA
jgi:hypothetical protein